jgi:hypothetical protein
MITCLNVWGKGFAVDEFLHRHKKIQATVIWREGEPRMRGKTQQNSGFKIELEDTNSFPGGVSDLILNLQSLSVSLADARTMGAACCLDIGLLVSLDRPVHTVHFPRELLLELATQEVDLQVSGYASSDKSNRG